ncbi:MAG: DUF4430 domain-containing protein [Eubacteriales bacterium]|nr:DUF4430 domain-containing protein [Eubacteriales bacterium]
MKKLLAFITALVIVLGCTVPAFAKNLNKPTWHNVASSHPGITSVTVAGTSAIFETDSNTDDEIYIRATLPNPSGTEYGLKNASVTITTTSGVSVTVLYNGNSVPYTSHVGNTYSYTLDLFNKRYTVDADGDEYILAAGINDGVVSIDSSDPLKLSGTLATNVTLDVYGSCQNNPYMGNPYYSGGWTFINYFFAGTLPTGTNLGNVSGSFTMATGASLSGCGVTSYTSGTTNFNFSSGNYFTLTNGSASRIYRPKLGVTGQTVSVSRSNYDFNFTELKASSTYYTSTVEAKVEAIETAWSAFLVNGNTTFSSGATAMDVLTRFINWAETNYVNNNTHYFTGTSNTNGGTYLSCLNGLDASDCGTMAGYMYSIDPLGYYWNSANDHSILASVGADAYVISDSTYVVWFYTVDYSNWINW